MSIKKIISNRIRPADVADDRGFFLGFTTEDTKSTKGEKEGRIDSSNSQNNPKG